jgi:hypothetical protein
MPMPMVANSGPTSLAMINEVDTASCPFAGMTRIRF